MLLLHTSKIKSQQTTKSLVDSDPLDIYIDHSQYYLNRRLYLYRGGDDGGN